MTAIAAAPPRAAASPARPAVLIVGGALLLAALLQSFVFTIDCDVSWMFTVGDAVLAGKRLYVDIIEVNPPASPWLYLPMVALAHLLDLRVEAVAGACTLAAAAASIAATLCLAKWLEPPPAPLLFPAALAFAALVLPATLFAQREHFALLLALPALTALALVADGRRLPVGQALAAGGAAGLVMVLKPHFALAMLPPALWAAWRRRSIAPLLVPGAAAAAVLLAYASAVLLFAADYLKILPVLAATYLPMREAPLRLLVNPVVTVPALVTLLAAALRPRPWPPLAIFLLMAMGGFAGAALLQGKGWLNHALPGMALGFVALAVLWPHASAEPSRRRLIAVAAALVAAMQFYACASVRPPPGLAEAVLRVAPPHPTMITLGAELSTGHPVTRMVGGTWVGSDVGLTFAAGARAQRAASLDPAARARLDRYAADDIAQLAADIVRERPQVVLVERAELPWMARQPALAAAMIPYHRATRAGDIEVWTRR